MCKESEQYCLYAHFECVKKVSSIVYMIIRMCKESEQYCIYDHFECIKKVSSIVYMIISNV